MQEVEGTRFLKEEGIDKRYNSIRRATYATFKCPECGKEYVLKLSKGVKTKTCRSCCKTNKSHGLANSRQYQCWLGMKRRCTDENHVSAKYYVLKGITYDPKWETFDGFWEDMQEGYSPDMTLDRIDSDKNYTKDNCRWVTGADNTRHAVTKPVIQICKMPDGSYSETEWACAADAAKALNLNANHISVVCQGKRKSHGGYGWQFKESELVQ